jgi:hypothetical protein
MKKRRTMVCQICGLKKKASEIIFAELICQPLENSIKKAHPEGLGMATLVCPA